MKKQLRAGPPRMCRGGCGLIFPVMFCVGFLTSLTGAQAFQGIQEDEDGRDVILVDNYHRSPKFMKLGGRINMAGTRDHLGRYMINDRVHGNGYSVFRLVLSDDFAFKTTTKPITPQSLQGIDVLLIINPDSTDYLKTANKISDEEIKAITAFVKAGGSLSVMANTPESVEMVQLNKLMRHFGVEFQQDWTPFYENPIPADNQFLFDVSNFHYGGGCSIRVLKNAPRARVEVVLRADSSGLKRARGMPGFYRRTDPNKWPFPMVKGGSPIITLSEYGKGKVLAVGDSGSWALDDISLADADNLAIVKQLFRRLRTRVRDTEKYRFSSWQKARYRVGVDRLIFGPDAKLLDLFPTRVKIKSENYGYEFRFSFSDFELVQQVSELDASGNATIRLGLQTSSDGFIGASRATFKLGPQGKIFAREIQDRESHRFINALIDDFAVLFSDHSWKVGQRWENEVWIRILPLELGRKDATVKKVKAKHIVDGIEQRRGRKCVKIITYAIKDMRDLDIADLVAPSLLERNGMSRFSIAEGMCVLEKEQYFAVNDGRLIDSESYLYYRVWLNGLGFEGDSGLIKIFDKVTLTLQ